MRIYSQLRKRILACKSSVSYGKLWSGLLEFVTIETAKREMHHWAIWRLCAFLKSPTNPRMVHNLRCLLDKEAFDLAMHFLVLHATDAERMQLGRLIAVLVDHAQPSLDSGTQKSSPSGSGNEGTAMPQIIPGTHSEVAEPRSSNGQQQSIRKLSEAKENALLQGAQSARVVAAQSTRSLDRIAGILINTLRIEKTSDPGLINSNEISIWRTTAAAVVLQRFVRRWRTNRVAGKRTGEYCQELMSLLLLAGLVRMDVF